MKTLFRHKRLICSLLLVLMVALFAMPVYAFASEGEPVTTSDSAEVPSGDNTISMKALAAGIAVGIAAAVGAFSMGMATSKSAESIARQPEADGKIRTALMLGLVFIETAIIYALLVVILIIFVL